MYKGFRVEEAGYLINNNLVDLNSFKKYITTFIVNPRMVKAPIKINDDRHWMVTTSEDKVSNSNKNSFLRKEGSEYILPTSNKKNFKCWYNTSDNSFYQPGDRIVVNHGIYLEAVYETNKSGYFKMPNQRNIQSNFESKFILN